MKGNDKSLRVYLEEGSLCSVPFPESSAAMSILVRVENPTVAKKIYSLTKSRYNVDIDLSVQRKMNLRKNNIYCLRILSRTTEILKDLGIYSARGLLEKPLAKITQKDCCARAYLAGAFMKAAESDSFAYNTDPIVSSDVIGETHGSIFDSTQTMVSKIDDNHYEVQVVSWYDNENSYTSQMVRTIKYFANVK